MLLKNFLSDKLLRRKSATRRSYLSSFFVLKCWGNELDDKIPLAFITFVAKPWQNKNQNQNKKDHEAIPVLRYGASYNFIKFRGALSKAALIEYWQLGKLIRPAEHSKRTKA